MTDIAPVAGNGLLDRRAFLRRSGILITGYAVSPANAEPLSEAEWSKEPGTLQGSQWSPSVFLGDRNRGWYGGTSLFFDFQNRPGKGSPLISSVVTVGRAWDCCSLTAQYFTFNVGLRHENRVVFSFRLNGIGTFGTEQIGQRFR